MPDPLGGAEPTLPMPMLRSRPPGSLVFTASACLIDLEGKVAAPADYVKQAELAVANLGTALQAAGAGFTDVVRTTVYVASAEQSDLVAVWSVLHAAFGAHDARHPARCR